MLQPDLISRQSTPNTAAYCRKRASFQSFSRLLPIRSAWLLASLAGPGGNATGFVVTEAR